MLKEQEQVTRIPPGARSWRHLRFNSRYPRSAPAACALFLAKAGGSRTMRSNFRPSRTSPGRRRKTFSSRVSGRGSPFCPASSSRISKARREGLQGKAALVAEEIQHPPAPGKVPHDPPGRGLVQVEARLLPLKGFHRNFHSPGFHPEPLHPLPPEHPGLPGKAFQGPNSRIVPGQDHPGPEALPQVVRQDPGEPVHPGREGLQDQDRAVTVRDQPRQEIGLGIDKAHTFPAIPRAGPSLQGRVQPGPSFVLQGTDQGTFREPSKEDPRARREEGRPQKPPLRAFHLHQVPGLPGKTLYLVPEDPGPPPAPPAQSLPVENRFQGAYSFSFFMRAWNRGSFLKEARSRSFRAQSLWRFRAWEVR